MSAVYVIRISSFFGQPLIEPISFLNRPHSIYQYSNMAQSLLGQNCKFFKFRLSLNSQKRLGYKENNAKFRSLSWKPWSHVRILMVMFAPTLYLRVLGKVPSLMCVLSFIMAVSDLSILVLMDLTSMARGGFLPSWLWWRFGMSNFCLHTLGFFDFAASWFSTRFLIFLFH